MKKIVYVVLAGLVAAVALAQTQYKVVFAGKTSSMAGVVAANKLSLSSKPYAAALGSSVSIDSKSKTASFVRNGKTAKVAVSIQKDIAYAPAVDVAKGLGLSAAVSGNTITVTNPAPVVPSTAPSVQGTAQQNGGDGVLGQTYTLCKGTDSAINYSITKLEYSIGNYLYDGGDKDDLLGSDKKALIISATVQNPINAEQYVSGSKIRFSGVDSKNQNVEGDSYWYEQGTMRGISINLRPGQKVNIYTRIVMDSDVSLPKLIVDDCNNAVWRYDLRGKVTPIPAPFADPNVPDGSSALNFFAAQYGVYYPGRTNFKLDRVEYSTAPWFDGSTAPEGGRWMILYFTVKNTTKAPIAIYGVGGLSFLDQDGISSRISDWSYFASRDSAFSLELQPNQELALRALIEVEKGIQPKKLRFAWHNSRTAEIDISNIK
jgi:hypothetical protein